MNNLKTLFNIVEERLKKLLNFDVWQLRKQAVRTALMKQGHR